MSTEQKIENNNRYYSVVEGTFRVQVPQDHEDAIRRDWTSKDGKTSGTKYEKHVRALFGTIEGMTLQDGEFGKNLNIHLDPNEDGETPVISLSVANRYGEDLLKKLPNLQKGVEYRFMPYAFTPEDKDTEVRGISVSTKNDEGKFEDKVLNFFWDASLNEGRGGVTNGYPEATEEDREDWAFYYKKANKFMVKYAEENVLPKFATVHRDESDADKAISDAHANGEKINPEDIPF